MIQHIRVLFFVDYAEIASAKGPAITALYYAPGFGHECVVIFFVLSGVFISRSVIRRHEKGTWSWQVYLTDRFVRLYIVLVPGLLLGLLWDRLGSSLSSARDLYYKPLLHFGEVIVARNLTPGSFVGNLAFLQTIVCAPFGSNGPLWSLANEFWYYMMFPAILLAWIGWRDKRWTIQSVAPYTLFVAFAAWLIGGEKTLGFIIWLFGFTVAVIGSRRRIPANLVNWFCSGTSILLLASLAFARSRLVAFAISDFIVGLSFALLVFGILQTNQRLPAFYSRMAGIFAGFSYSLYVLHLPLVLFLRALISPHERWQPDARHLLSGACIVVLTVSYAYVISRVTEAQTDRVRKWVRQEAKPASRIERETQSQQIAPVSGSEPATSTY